MSNDSRPEYIKLLEYVLKHRKRNMQYAFAWILASILIVFLVIPKIFTAEVSVLPTAGGVEGLGGQLGSLASLAGVSFGSSSNRSPEMYQGIIYSKQLLDRAIFREYETAEGQKVNLLQFLELDDENKDKNHQKALKALRDDIISVNIDPDNSILYLSVSTEDPKVSADVANFIIEVLNEIVLNDLEKEVHEQTVYLKERIKTTSDSLNIAEAELKKMLETSRDITLPQFQVDRIRAQRKLELQTAIYVEMRKQMELVKLDNYLRLTPIKTLDKAFPPWRKSRPKRALLLISIGLLLGLVQLGINYAFYLYPQVKQSINSEA